MPLTSRNCFGLRAAGQLQNLAFTGVGTPGLRPLPLAPSVTFSISPHRSVKTAFATMAKPKLHGRAFYESLGSPKYIVAPMVDQSEFAWRLLTRSFLPAELRTSILAYSPMLHAKMFAESPKYRAQHFEPLNTPLAMPQTPAEAQLQTLTEEDAYLDGNPKIDRPLFVQFCANDPQYLFQAAKVVQPYCDAVDLNLGCPQGIAKRGHYGAFLQEDWDTIYKLINTLHKELDIPVTAKFRILETREKTLEYAKMLLSAGASIITCHGRQREQKGHNTGLADWSVLRYLREQLPPETVIFANGNILQYDDIAQCLEQTKADGVMSAEGNLYDPTIFATPPPVGDEGREYWRGRDGKGGYRVDAVLRRYLDIIHQYVLSQDSPARAPLFLSSDSAIKPIEAEIAHEASNTNNKRPAEDAPDASCDGQAPPSKKQKKRDAKQEKKNAGKPERVTNPNLVAMQAHCFHLLRFLVKEHHDVRDALARSRAGDLDAYENVLRLTQEAVKKGLVAYETNPTVFEEVSAHVEGQTDGGLEQVNGVSAAKQAPEESSDEAVRRCKRPYWVCQPYVRPLPKEAIERGSMQLSKKELKKLAEKENEIKKNRAREDEKQADEAGVAPGGKIEAVPHSVQEEVKVSEGVSEAEKEGIVEVPNEGMVCG